MKVLFISNLFPDAENPNRGIYNAQLLAHLSELCDIRVISPRPTRGFPPLWFPKKFISRKEDERFTPVFVPTAYIPKIGSRLNHLLMARSIEPVLKKVREDFACDVILNSWIYPDACAAAELTRENKLPFVAIAQGSDVHQYLKIPARQKIISKAMSRASSVVARSKDLAQQLERAGVAEEKLQVIYNGVNFQTFCPGKKQVARKELGLPENARILLFVGNFLPIKNPLLLVEAHAELCRNQPDKKYLLVMIGSGPLTGAAKKRAEILGTSDSVWLPGSKPSDSVARYMQAADVLCVPSHNEGVPNVILEAFACGLRVVARAVGGIPEVFSDNSLGRLVAQSDPPSLASAIADVMLAPLESEQIFRHARRFSWDTTARRYFDLLQKAMKSHPTI